MELLDYTIEALSESDSILLVMIDTNFHYDALGHETVSDLQDAVLRNSKFIGQLFDIAIARYD